MSFNKNKACTKHAGFIYHSFIQFSGSGVIFVSIRSEFLFQRSHLIPSGQIVRVSGYL